MLVSLVLAVLACNGLAPAAGTPVVPLLDTPSAPPSQSATTPPDPSAVASPASTGTRIVIEIATSEPPTAEPSFTPSPTTVPTPTEPPIETYIAYAQNNALFVAHVVAGQVLDTRQLTAGLPNAFILAIDWSPSGQYLSYREYAVPGPHLFYVNAFEGGTPVDLGFAGDSAWSPDSTLLAYDQEYELRVVSVASGQTRRLTNHLGTGWLWGRMAFTPAGDALVAAGALTDDMDPRTGNTLYRLYRVPLDGSAANAYPSKDMPSLTEELSGSLPSALSFSPDGQKLAFAAWTRIDACANHTTYYVSNADGSDLRALPVPSLAALGGPDQKMYFFGDSLLWTPDSAGLWLKGQMKDCGQHFKIVGGPQISRVTLDGQEHEIIPGKFGEDYHGQISLDRTGALLGVLNTTPTKPRVQILGLDGHLVLDLGEAELGALQP